MANYFDQVGIIPPSAPTSLYLQSETPKFNMSLLPTTNSNIGYDDYNNTVIQYDKTVSPDGYDAYMVKQYQNGRVTDVNSVSLPRPNLFEELNGAVPKHFDYECLTGIQEASVLSRLFFSKKNMNIIQNAIRKSIYDRSNGEYLIDRQNDTDIEVIMRSIYLQHSPNLNHSITKQIAFLNQLVIDWSVPNILSEITQYNGYLQDIQFQPMPIDRSINLSSKGTRTLRSVTTTF